jgi:hypothetical protein
MDETTRTLIIVGCVVAGVLILCAICGKMAKG